MSKKSLKESNKVIKMTLTEDKLWVVIYKLLDMLRKNNSLLQDLLKEQDTPTPPPHPDPTPPWIPDIPAIPDEIRRTDDFPWTWTKTPKNKTIDDYKTIDD